MRRDIFSTTRKNIIAMSLGMVMGTLIVFALITQTLFSKSLFSDIDQQLLTHKNMMINEMHIQYLKGKAVEITLPSPLSKELINYVWQEGELVKESPHPYKGTHAYPIFPKTDEIVTIQDGAYVYRGIEFTHKGVSVQVLLSVESQIHTLKQLRKALVIAFLAFTLVGLWTAYILAKIALKPLYKAYHKQAEFIQDASHEMRTPLAILRGKIELLVRTPKDSIEAHYHELASMMSELSGLEKLNKDLLLLSKEDMQGILEVEPIHLENFIEEILEFYKEVGKLHDVCVVGSYQEEQKERIVYWDKVKVKRCISILLENAIKYSQSKEKVILKVQIEERMIDIQVIDEGIGIRQEALSQIFNRFYRSNEVRASGVEGNGIGLSLLQSLAYTMGIKIKVKSEYGKGSCFALSIPKKMKSK